MLTRAIHEPLLRTRSDRDLRRQGRRPLRGAHVQRGPGVPDPDRVVAGGLASQLATISQSRDALHESFGLWL